LTQIRVSTNAQAYNKHVGIVTEVRTQLYHFVSLAFHEYVRPINAYKDYNYLVTSI